MTITHTPAQVSAAAAKAIAKARAVIVLDHPFFATIMLKRPFSPVADIPTLAVSDSGNIYYNPEFIAGLSPQEVVFAICHEILHYASGHGLRRGDRDPKKWNIAGDMWINDTLKKAGFTLIPGVLDVPGSSDRTVEDIYAGFPPDDDNGNGTTGQGKTPQNSSDPMGNDMEPDEQMSESERSERDAQRKMDVAEAAQVAKMQGNLPGILQKFAADTIASKTPWYEILERHMVDMTATDTSWAKPNRRYAPDFYLPSTTKTPAMGEVVIQVDISGSVSAQEIKHYNGHMKRIVEQCRPSKVHVIYTDTDVVKHDEYEDAEDVEIRYHSGGGTDMRAGFDYIKEHGIEPAVVVTLTDGFTPWPDETDYPAVWCISHASNKAPCGVNVHFELEH